MSDKPCINCGAIPTELHHVIPKSLGGQDIPSNLVPLCSKCHALIHGLDPNKRGIITENGNFDHGELVKQGKIKCGHSSPEYKEKLKASILASKAINKTKNNVGGKPRIYINEDLFLKEYNLWKSGLQTAKKTMENLGLKPNTFYRRVKDYELTGILNKKREENINFPLANFCNDCYKYKLNEISLEEISIKYHLKPMQTIKLAEAYGYKIY